MRNDTSGKPPNREVDYTVEISHEYSSLFIIVINLILRFSL